MLNTEIKNRILLTLEGSVLSTSMVSRKAGYSRITTAKYLHSLAGKNIVQAVRVGKAVAWRVSERKPIIGIIAKTGVSRMVKLCLGNHYQFVLATQAHTVHDAFLIITDDKRIVKSASVPVILIGSFESDAWSLPELFDSASLSSLVKKVLQEQSTPQVDAIASISVEHIDDLEEALGIDVSDELLSLLANVLTENRVHYRQFARNTFLIEQPVGEHIIADIEQMFHVILSHVYGRMVSPGERIIEEGISHTVPSLTIAVNAFVDINN